MKKTSKTSDFQHIFESITSKKGSKILLIIGIIGIGLILLSQFWPTSTNNSSDNTSSSINMDEYSKQLENKLDNIIGQIQGVGKVSVMVTVGSGVEYVYEQDTKTSVDSTDNTDSDGSKQNQMTTDQENNPVVINGQNGGEQPLIKTELQPKVLGVVVVCDGGEDPVICEEIIDTVSTALDLPANHISVNQRKK